jgi:hypothetical protein
MTDCPCCGGTNTAPNYSWAPKAIVRCLDCGAEWDESRRVRRVCGTCAYVETCAKKDRMKLAAGESVEVSCTGWRKGGERG